MFNALVMSYSRLPLAMARDGMLPKVFAKTSAKTQTPWVAILVCAACWALCLKLNFTRLVTLDIMLYGASLALEFVTLVALRIREPKLERGFKVPGGLAGAISCGVFPVALMSLAMVESGNETILGMNGMLFGGIIIAAGFILYIATKPLRRSVVAPAASLNVATAD
jgi:amino acid transporter